MLQKCPVCDGKGVVPYDPYLPTLNAHNSAGPWMCKLCGGSGVIDTRGLKG